MNLEYCFWMTIAGLCVIASMVNRYQWRKAWEAYYKRPLQDNRDHKAPDGRTQDEEEKN